MSSQPVTHDLLPETAAQEIDCNFQDIADSLPGSVKKAALGIAILLFEKPGIAKLQSMYLGNRIIRLAVIAEGHSEQLSFFKDYELRLYGDLRDASLRKKLEGGEPHQLAETKADELLDCPTPLTKLVFAIEAMRSGYIGQRWGDDDTSVASAQAIADRL